MYSTLCDLHCDVWCTSSVLSTIGSNFVHSFCVVDNSNVVQVCPNLDILVPALVEGGIDELEKRCALTPGVFWHCPFCQEFTSQNVALACDAYSRHGIAQQQVSALGTDSLTQIGSAIRAIECLVCHVGTCAMHITPDTLSAHLLLSIPSGVCAVVQHSCRH